MNKLNVSVDSMDGMLVILREIRGHAQEPGALSVDAISFIFSILIKHKKLNFGFMVKKPVEMKRFLPDNILIHCRLHSIPRRIPYNIINLFEYQMTSLY